MHNIQTLTSIIFNMQSFITQEIVNYGKFKEQINKFLLQKVLD